MKNKKTIAVCGNNRMVINTCLENDMTLITSRTVANDVYCPVDHIDYFQNKVFELIHQHKDRGLPVVLFQKLTFTTQGEGDETHMSIMVAETNGENKQVVFESNLKNEQVNEEPDACKIRMILKNNGYNLG